MSQHDFNIANQLFPATRTDINNALVALATNSSGGTAPASPQTYQFWLDTSATPAIKIYDGTDWITIGTLDTVGNTFAPSGAIENVVEDTTPQLGANLDMQTYHLDRKSVV